MIEYCVDRLFAGILWWFLRFIQTAFLELVHMAFVGVFLVPRQYRPVRQSFVWWYLFLRMSCCFCRHWKELYRQDRNVSYGARRFSWTLLAVEWVYRRRSWLSCEHCFWFRKFVLRVAIMEPSKTSVFLGMSRDKLSTWRIFLDVRNSILKL